jgi:hypothetical protein
MDLHVLLEGSHAKLSVGGMSIVLLHMGGTVLVKNKVLVITTIMQVLESQENVRAHGIILVPPKEMVVEGSPHLASILLGSELLNVLPCT